jgi:SAM-dependent methyltransferase
MACSPANVLHGIRANTAPGVHETVLSFLRCEEPGRILDAAAGEGALSKQLVQMGFNVEACDINPTQYKLTDIKCRRVDLNQPLPYPSEYFDSVVCVEAIEHLCDPWATLAEFKRILKRNGTLVITTPNILSITSRLCFLLWGEYAYFSYGERLWQVSRDELGKHISPLNFWQLEYALVKNNMTLESIKANRPTPRKLSLIPALILGPLIRAVTRWHFKQEISTLLNSDALFHGEILVLKARSL